MNIIISKENYKFFVKKMIDFLQKHKNMQKIQNKKKLIQLKNLIIFNNNYRNKFYKEIKNMKIQINLVDQLLLNCKLENRNLFFSKENQNNKMN